ncbi:MFS transporter [Streptomyces sp. NPDC002698]|uniref:MFS transporter n=1 Tax=Streptomyces sp. NPDC002698 TaxID=3364660 RepID=UPI003679F8C1
MTIASRMGFPRGRHAARYGVAGLVNATGTGLFYPFALLFFHHQVAAPMVQIGACYTVAMGLGVAGVTRTGRLVDRFGARNVLVTDTLIRAAVFAAYPFVHHLAAFVALATVVSLAERTDQVASQALVAGLVPDDERPGWFALSRMTLNAGMGGGALIGGLLLASSPGGGYHWLAWANAVSFVVAAALYLPLRPVRAAAVQAAERTTGAWRDGLFLRIAVLSGLLYLVGLAVEVGLPVYLIQYLHEPAWTVSLVFAVNTGLIVLFQLPVTERTRRRPAMRMLACGTAGYALTFLVFLTTHRVEGTVLVVSLVLAVCLFTVGELITSVTSMVIVNGLAPDDRRGSYIGVGQFFVGLGTTAAPLLFTVGLALSPGGLWLGLALLSAGIAAAVLRLRVPVTARLAAAATAVTSRAEPISDGPGARRRARGSRR